ncbi:seminal fluid protein HACP057 [Danaus plexippus plexippus]|uniref:Seminal fluid protein HACP057 n=1 Tax=Danaus plexippus plexippus TaxID=278856 RepID=A0A212EKJ7_DANPL|nr:seminal fluid protein HACP057 [Danaus plexippus plexippus]
MKNYNRHYKNEADKEVHYLAFVETLKVINRRNALPHSDTHDINKFSDYTPEELKKIYMAVILQSHKLALVCPQHTYVFIMKAVICLFFIALIAISNGDKPHYDINKAPQLFELFMKNYNRHYKNEADKEAHYQAFVENLKTINRLNALPHSATHDINKFSDYTPEELKQIHDKN